MIEKLVVEALLDQLLQPERVTAILTTLKGRCDDRQDSADRRLVDLGRQVGDAGERLSRLYAPIEASTIDGTDPTLKERVAALKATRDRALEALDYARKSSALPIANPRPCSYICSGMVPLAGIEPALLAELDFESSASTNSATGASGHQVRA